MSWNVIEKKHLDTRGLEPASPVFSQHTCNICSRPSCISQKKGCIKPRAKQHCLFSFVQC